MRNFTLSLLLLVAFNGGAQSTYQSTDFAGVGDSFLVSHSVNGLALFDFTQTGANFTWDFSTLEPATQETISYENPANTGYKTTWCFLNGYLFNCNSQFANAFNLAAPVSEGLELQGYGMTDLTAHYKVTTSSLQAKMLGAMITVNDLSVPITVDYSDADEIYDFPITYNTTFTHTAAFSLDLSTFGVPVQYASASTRTNTVEGWGTLVTPYATFSNVLKMKTTLVTDYTITTTAGTAPVSRTTVSYKWFDPSKGIPVLEVTGELVNDVWVPTDITYIDNPQCLDPVALFGYFSPTPTIDATTHQAVVSFINLSQNFDQYSWLLPDGTTSSAQTPEFTFDCPGTYEVTLTVTNTFCDPDLTDTLTLPVIVTDPDNVYTDEVTVEGNVLTAVRDLPGTTYQWFICEGEIIPGATSNSLAVPGSGSYSVQLTSNGCVSMSDCYSANLGVSDFKPSKWQLAPNPATTRFDVIAAPADLQIDIFDVTGKKVGQGRDISELAPGLYLVSLKSAEGNAVEKLVKR